MNTLQLHEQYKQHGMEGMRAYCDQHHMILHHPLESSHSFQYNYYDHVLIISTTSSTFCYWIDMEQILPLQHGLCVPKRITTTMLHESCHGYLCGKREGYELVVTIYPPASIAYTIIKTILSPQHCLVAEGQCGLIVISTRNSLVLDPSLWDYFLTALYATLDKPTSKKISVWENWFMIQPYFSQWIDRQVGYMSFSLDSMTTLHYEMICAHRTTYIGKVHDTCPVSYPSSSITLQAVYHEDQMVPHFLLPETKSIVSHPLCIPITSLNEINQLVADVTSVLLGEVSQIEFMEFYHPECTSYELDARGFFYYEKTKNNTNDYDPQVIITIPLYEMIQNGNVPRNYSLPDSIMYYFPTAFSQKPVPKILR